MAIPGQDDLRALEQTRQRLQGLHTSLTALQQDLFAQQPLPSWASLQSHSALVSSNLQAVAQQLAEHQTLLSSLIVHPLPQFPNHQGGILENILRTKLEPDVKDWLEQAQTTGRPKSENYTLSDRDRNELWQWAPSAANAKAREQKWGADYTLAEKESGIGNVSTGLKRELVEPLDDVNEDDDDDYDEVTDEEEEEDVDKMDLVQVRSNPGGQGLEMSISTSTPAGPQMPLESIHKFMMTGKMGS